jgi:hypothetical protein
VDEIPKGGNGSTDCSVVLDGEEFNITGNRSVGGALEVTSGGGIDLTTRGNVTISDYLRLDASDGIVFDVEGAEAIGGPVQFNTNDEVTATIQTEIGSGLCVEKSGGVDLTLQSANAAIGGPVSLTSTGEVTVSGNGSGSEIDGNFTIDAEEVSIGGEDGSVDLTVNGDLTIDAEEVSIGGEDGSVDLTVNGGNVAVRTQDGEVDVTLSDTSKITGELRIEGADEPEVSGCSAVQGTVTPAGACSADEDD